MTDGSDSSVVRDLPEVSDDYWQRSTPHNLASRTLAHQLCPIDLSKSQKLDKIYPGGVFPIRIGLRFDPDTWDGSSLFMPHDTNFVVLTDDVVRALNAAKVKDALIPMDSIEFD
jgi:hypothetical protein